MSVIGYLSKLTLKDISLKRIARIISERIYEFPHNILWSLPLYKSKLNKEKIKKYRNIHEGKRCIIIANGPSIKNIDLSLIKNEIIICMNRGFKIKDMYGISPTYLVSIDIKNQLSQFKEEYNRVDIPHFYNWNSRRFFSENSIRHFIKIDHKHIFKGDILKGIWGAHSVTYACFALAYYFGIREVILIGKDHSYSQEGKAHQKVISDGKEQNHFIDGYYKKGMRWDIPDYVGEELAYSLVKKAFENDGRKIFDATIGGKLSVFNKVDYYSLFNAD